jgi:hypothetical protein
MLKGLIKVLLFIALASCTAERSDVSDDVVAQVFGKTMYRTDLANVIPDALTGVDSAELAQKYIQEWVYNELLLQKAKINVGTDPEILKMIDDYSNSLLISKYLELLVAQKGDFALSEQEIYDYYAVNTESFVLSEAVIKGLYFQLPANAPKISQVEKWLRGKTEEDLLELENYCFQNARKYDNFTDKWMSASVVLKPFTSVTDNIIRSGVTFESSDSLYRHYLLVFDVIKQSDYAPLEFVKPGIERILLHKKRVDYIDRVKKDLLNDALNNKTAILNETNNRQKRIKTEN